MKNVSILLSLLLFFIVACDNGKKTGEKIIQCPDQPLKGHIKLKVEEILTIDSLTIDKEKPPLFNIFTKDRNGSIYISNNYPGIAVYKFAKDGTFLKKFLSKGEGPGELRSLHFLENTGDSILAGSMNKIIEFDLDGNYISEKRLKRWYHSITMIDKQHFIANYQKAENDTLKRGCSIINKNDENNIIPLLQSDRKNIGETIIGEGDNAFSVSLFGVTPDYISKYCDSNRLIYQCLSDEPEIYIKNRNGELLSLIKTNFKNKELDEDDKNEIMSSFVHSPADMKKAVRKSLPKKMLAIRSLQVLPKGYLAVHFFKKYGEYEIRIFDQDGQFEYILEVPAGLAGRWFTFTKKGLACIKRAEERNLYVEYKITNLPGIFSQKN